MSNLSNITYTTLNINNILLFNYLNNNNYSYNDVLNKFATYSSTYITNLLEDLINDSTINYLLIENILPELITANTIFGNLFTTSGTSPFYTYNENMNEVSFIISINISSVMTYFLVVIKNEEIIIPRTPTTTIPPTTTTPITTIPPTTTTTDSTIISSETVSTFFNNEIVFVKSLNSVSEIFEQVTNKNIWELVTLVDDLDIVYDLTIASNIVIQITAGINITTNKSNIYSWGLFNTVTNVIAKTSHVYSNLSNSSIEYNVIKSVFFHMGKLEEGSYKYKWIHKDDTGINNIKLDTSYPVTIIAWKINSVVNDININYLQHLSQKINELQIGYNHLSERIDKI